MTVSQDITLFGGGEDLVSTALAIKPGRALLAYNYELGRNGGYTRIEGYERFDGRTAPSTNQGSVTLTFDNGVVEVVVGVQIITDTESASGTVTAVSVTSGSWAGGDAAGTLTLGSVNGEFVADDVIIDRITLVTYVEAVSQRLASADLRQLIQPVPGDYELRGVWVYNDKVYAFRDQWIGGEVLYCVLHVATSSGWVEVSTPSLVAGGRYEFVNANFKGSSSSLMMYGVDGKNPAFQFDGTTFTQLTTGMTVNTPDHIAFFKNYLFVSFPGGSLQHSALGDPTDWSVLWGAGEIGIGNEITGLKTLPGGVMAVFGERRTDILSGTVHSDFAINEHNLEVGAAPHTIQRANLTLFLDEMGVTSLETTQAFGDFIDSTISDDVKPFIDAKSGFATASAISKRKGNYLLYYTESPNTSVLILSMKKGKVQGFTRAQYPFALACTGFGKIGSDERIFAGDSNGWVYELDSGYSFDGRKIESYLRLAFNHLKNPTIRKRFRKLMLDLDCAEEIQVKKSVEFDYGDYKTLQPGFDAQFADGHGGYWNAAEWDAFVWSGVPVYRLQSSVEGSGMNIGVLLYTRTIEEAPHTLHGMIVHYENRRLTR